MPVVYDSYTDVFGGSPVQPSNIAYSAIALTADLALDWPQSYLDSPNVVTRIIDVLSETEDGWIITLPDATQVSVGQDFLIFNRGTDNFILNDNAGSELLTIDTGEAFYFYLTDNTTAAGVWSNVVFGTGTSGADAALLAGYGLTAFSNHLNTLLGVTKTNVTPRAIDATDRASLIIWLGGAGIFNLPDATTMPDGFYFSVNNEGDGQLILRPNGVQTIDSNTQLIVNPSASLSLTTDGLNWYTLGLGQPAVLTISAQTYTLTNQNITVTEQEATSIEQFYIGTLTGNVVITYPTAPNYWFIYNNVTVPSAFTVSVTVSGGTPLVIPNGARTIVYTDGTTNLYNTPTFVDGQFVRFPNGTAAAPSITFNNDNTTGMYLPAVGSLGLTAGGNNFLTATAVTATVNKDLAISGTNTLTVGTGATILGGTLGVTGAATLGGTLGVTGLTSLSTLGTSGLATLNSASVTTALGVTGTSTLGVVNTGNLSITGTNTLTVGTGATTLGGTLGVTGLTTVSSIQAANGLVTAPAYAFGSTTGMYYNTGTVSVNIALAGTDFLAVGIPQTTLSNTLFLSESAAANILFADNLADADAPTGDEGTLYVVGGILKYRNSTGIYTVTIVP